MTKEEILSHWDWSNKSEILEAMEEYAKLVAVDFGKWISLHPIDFQRATKGRWIGLNMEYKTSEELFNEYIELCATSSNQ